MTTGLVGSEMCIRDRCVCVCERERERERMSVCESLYVSVCESVCVCVCRGVDEMNFRCAQLWHIHMFISTFCTMPVYNICRGKTGGAIDVYTSFAQ